MRVSGDLCQMYVRSFKRVYESEIRRFVADVKASLGSPMDIKKSKFLPKVYTLGDEVGGVKPAPL